MHFLSIAFLIFFFTIGFVVTGIINNQLSREKLNINTKAAGPYPEPACTARSGECQGGFSGDRRQDNGATCTLSDGRLGKAVIDACPSQPETVRCCVPNASPEQVENVTASLAVSLQGIGPNANIVDQQRTATIKIFENTESFDRATYTASDSLTFDPASGRFLNPNFNFGQLPNGEYQMVIQINSYLDEQLKTSSGEIIFKIGDGLEFAVASVAMKAGDIEPSPGGDNEINIFDYNNLLGCMPGSPPNACFNKKKADLNNDGQVDQLDFDILKSNYGDMGFGFKTDKFSCEPDPNCVSGKNSLQLCSLYCKIKTVRS